MRAETIKEEWDLIVHRRRHHRRPASAGKPSVPIWTFSCSNKTILPGAHPSRTSKMVHGGLRYLKQGKPLLTMASVEERERPAPGGPGSGGTPWFSSAHL